MNNVSARFNIGMIVKGDNSDVADLGIATANVSQTAAITLAHGTASGKANKIYADTATVTGGSQIDIDLQTALDAVGVALGLNFLKVLYIKNQSDAEFEIGWKTGGIAGNAISLFGEPDDNTAILLAGGVFLWADTTAGIVVDATHKVLRINSDGSGSKEFDIIAVGIKS